MDPGLDRVRRQRPGHTRRGAGAFAPARARHRFQHPSVRRPFGQTKPTGVHALSLPRRCCRRSAGSAQPVWQNETSSNSAIESEAKIAPRRSVWRPPADAIRLGRTKPRLHAVWQNETNPISPMLSVPSPASPPIMQASRLARACWPNETNHPANGDRHRSARTKPPKAILK